MTTSGGSWESLEPWDKAAQWKAVAPEITDELVRLAKAKAMQDRREQARLAKESLEAAQFNREMQKGAVLRSHELELKRVELQTARELRVHALEMERLVIQKTLERRLWWLQLIALIGGLIAIAGLIVTGLQLSESPTTSGASVTVFSLGSTLAAALLGTNVAVNRKLQSLIKDRRGKPGSEAATKSDEEGV